MTTQTSATATITLDHDVVMRAIDGHFTGRGPKAGLVRVAPHLESCTRCRGYFAQRELLARLDPQAVSARERIARGAGLSLPKATRAPLFGALATAGVLAAALFVVGDAGDDTSGFTARGSGRPSDVAASDALVRIFRITGNESVPVGDEIAVDDELAFAYRNPNGRSHLMIFAVDDRREIYWYHPAWTDPDADPSSVAVSSGEAFRELTEAVRHDLHASKNLRVYALFSDAPTTVRAVEREMQDSGALPPGAQLLTEVRVRHSR
jgi:hypothetical protein